MVKQRAIDQAVWDMKEKEIIDLRSKLAELARLKEVERLAREFMNSSTEESILYTVTPYSRKSIQSLFAKLREGKE